MKGSCVIAIGAGVVTAVVLSGCGSVGKSVSLSSVDRSDLATMVVPKSALGSEAQRLERDDDSGPSDNADAADDTIDPKDTARDLQRAGRIAGYDLYYSNFDSLVGTSRGLAVIGTSVELFRDAPAPRGT